MVICGCKVNAHHSRPDHYSLGILDPFESNIHITEHGLITVIIIFSSVSTPSITSKCEIKCNFELYIFGALLVYKIEKASNLHYNRRTKYVHESMAATTIIRNVWLYPLKLDLYILR